MIWPYLVGLIKIEKVKKTIKNPISDVVAYICLYCCVQFSRYILNIKVVDISGKEASWKQLLVRFLINRPSGELLTRFIGEEGAIISLGLWYIAMGISTVVAEDGRGFPDKMAKTVVVMRDESTSDSNKSTLA